MSKSIYHKRFRALHESIKKHGPEHFDMGHYFNECDESNFLYAYEDYELTDRYTTASIEGHTVKLPEFKEWLNLNDLYLGKRDKDPLLVQMFLGLVDECLFRETKWPQLGYYGEIALDKMRKKSLRRHARATYDAALYLIDKFASGKMDEYLMEWIE